MPPFSVKFDKRQRNQDSTDDQRPKRDGTFKKNGEAALRHDERPAQVGFKHGTEDKSQDQRRGFIVEFLKQITDDAEAKHDAHIKNAGVDGVGADQAK